MTRIDADLTKQALGRLPDEGFHRLFNRRKDALAVNERKLLARRWPLVNSDLRAVFSDLANKKARWPLFLWGGVGRGKTVAAQLFALRVEVGRYWTVDQVMNLAGSDDGPPWAWVMGYGFSLTVLDELGLPRPSDAARNWEYDVVKQFIDWRKDRPAIYISNQPLERLAKETYDARIESRLAAGTVFELRDHDRRRQ